jgi:glycosyltransferase involved in cell wall biosynthesis
VNPCLLIPIYDHGATIGDVVSGLAFLGLPCLLVDDGSHEETRAALGRVCDTFSWVQLARHACNRGRGAALRTGYHQAACLGYSHVVQLDADGQHDPRDVPALLVVARSRPDALVLGAPIFDESAPRSRRYGRWISRFWVWLETGSLAIRDPLCGLRAVPLAPTLRLLRRVPCGDRMDFDTEMAVRLVWQGVSVRNVPVRVRYFADGISHFHMLGDNLRLSWLHARLFCGMWLHLPRLILRRIRGAAT